MAPPQDGSGTPRQPEVHHTCFAQTGRLPGGRLTCLRIRSQFRVALLGYSPA